jgi:hypothetical protein
MMNTNGPLLIRDNLRYQHSGHSWPMRHKELYEALGLNPNRHLPEAGLSDRMVGNVRCWVIPKIQGKSQDAARVKCQCPHCGKILTAGKFHQHFKTMHTQVKRTLVVVRRLADGKPSLLGRANYHDGKGWKFMPNVSGRDPSRRFWPTWEACLPKWVGYPNHCESLTLAQWMQEISR